MFKIEQKNSVKVFLKISGLFLIGFCLVFAALLPSHLIFTCFMHGFNKTLSVMAECAFMAGIVILPGPATYPSPHSWLAASGSALFFTLTIGALSYSAGDVCASLSSRRLSSIKSRVLASFCIILLFSFLLFFTGMPYAFPLSFFVTGVLAAVFRLLYFKEYELRKRMSGIFICFTAIILIVLSIQGSGFFAGIRDKLLFGTSAGEEIIDFYYKYNLFAAEVIKKPELRIVKALMAGETDQASVFEEIRNTFEKKGFAFIKGNNCKARYDISLKNGNIEISSGEKLVFSAGVDRLKSDPVTFFREFYSKSDNAGYLRFMIFASFCFGIPLIFVGLVVDSLLPVISSFKKKNVFTAVTVLIVMAVLFIFLNHSVNAAYNDGELKTMLGSQDHEKRIAAMDFIIKKKMDPDEFRMTDVVPGKGVPRERILFLYLASRTGGGDRFQSISPFVDDPYPYVACQAIRFLSQLRDIRSLPVFEKIMRTNSNLYVQLTAMEALKSWKNRKT